MNNKLYFIDNPLVVTLTVCVWWCLWASAALFSDRFIPPTTAAPLFILLSLTFFISTFAFVKYGYRKNSSEVDLCLKRYPLFKFFIVTGGVFFIFVCVPAIIKDPFGYRLSIFSDDARGIESSIFPNSGLQFLFMQLFYFFPITGIIIAAFNGEKILFKQSALMLICCALITLSRGLYLTIFMLYLAMPGIKHRLVKVFLLVLSLSLLFDTYTDYHILGFSLLEKFIYENELDTFIKFNGLSTFTGFTWPFFTFFRLFDKSFKTDFEVLSSNNSLFVDIGRYEELYFNAFYTLMQGPAYDFGLSSFFILGIIFGLIVYLIARIKDKFIYRSFMGLMFITCLNGVQMNSISDRLILTYILIVFLIKKFHAKST